MGISGCARSEERSDERSDERSAQPLACLRCPLAVGRGSVDLERAANGVCLDGGLELRPGVVDECLVDVDVLEAQRAAGAVGEEAFECAGAGVEADRQADLVGSVLEARLPGSVLVERSQLVCEAFEFDGVDDRAMAGVEASAALEVELGLAAQGVGVPA
jgi:hypothetical protein